MSNKTVFTDSKQLLHNYSEDKNIPQIINSICDLDYYKITMLYYFYKKEPNSISEFKFFNRGAHKFPVNFDSELRKQVKFLDGLYFTDEEIDFIRISAVGGDGKSYFDEGFFVFLKGFRLDSSMVSINQIGEDLDLTITGLHFKIKLYETLIMSIMVELRNIMTYQIPEETIEEINLRDVSKFMLLDKIGATLSDFSSRRRYSYNNQDRMLSILSKHNCCIGSSNVHFCMRYNLTPTGTSAHSLITYLACKHGVLSANSHYLGTWTDLFSSEISILLTDTFTTENFLKSFDAYYCKLSSGVRHDSGCPFLFATTIIKHYITNGIDPTTKTIVFSDGINDLKLVERLVKHCKGKINISFGIGTYLSNDIKGIEPMNIVIKLSKTFIPTRGEWSYACKISDNPAKITCVDKETININKLLLGIK